jgi:hypothetical protein
MAKQVVRLEGENKTQEYAGDQFHFGRVGVVTRCSNRDMIGDVVIRVASEGHYPNYLNLSTQSETVVTERFRVRALQHGERVVIEGDGL